MKIQFRKGKLKGREREGGRERIWIKGGIFAGENRKKKKKKPASPV